MPFLRRNNGPSEMDISALFLGPSYPLPEPQYKFVLTVAISPLRLTFWRASFCPLLSPIIPSACYILTIVKHRLGIIGIIIIINRCVTLKSTSFSHVRASL